MTLIVQKNKPTVLWVISFFKRSKMLFRLETLEYWAHWIHASPNIALLQRKNIWIFIELWISMMKKNDKKLLEFPSHAEVDFSTTSDEPGFLTRPTKTTLEINYMSFVKQIIGTTRRVRFIFMRFSLMKIVVHRRCSTSKYYSSSFNQTKRHQKK